MIKQDYNNQVITEYLLGSLPAAEAEHFDELSFTDEEFADALNSVENQLVDSYVNGELTGTQLETFKSYYLASPARREKVNFAQVFQVFAEQDFAQTNQEKPQAVESKRSGAGLFSILNILAIPNPVMQWGFAASALLFVFLAGWLWIENTRLNQQTGEMQAKMDVLVRREQDLQNQLVGERTANSETEKELVQVSKERTRLEQEIKTERAQQRQSQRLSEQLSPSGQTLTTSPKISTAFFVLMPQMRGSNSIRNLSIPARTRYLMMQLQLESDDYISYQVALTDQSGNKSLWQSSKLNTKTAKENKVLNVRFPAKLLKSKFYSLSVSGIKSNGEVEIISDYPFQAVIK